MECTNVLCNAEMEQVDETEDVKLYECPECGHDQGVRKVDFESRRVF